jgi:hypothetical protein
MALSFHDATVPQFLQILPGVLANLDRAEAWAKEKGVPASEILGKQLAPDMHSLAYQFRYAMFHSAGAIRAAQAGLFQVDVTPAPEDFATLRTMLNDAVTYLKSVDAAEFEALQDREVAFEYGGNVLMRFSAVNYLLSFALPNFYFHVSMAYAILRNLGFDVGKRDFLGAPKVNMPA